MNQNNSLDNLLQQGNLQLERGQHEAGLEIFQQADNLFPNDLQVQYGLGLVYFYLERYQNSIKYLNLALQIQTVYLLALVRRGMAYKALGHAELANKDFISVLHTKPKNSEDWRATGIAYNELQYSTQALSCFSKALKINSEDHFSWDAKGLIYLDKKQYQKALSCCSKALSVFPDKQTSWASCGIAWEELEKYSDALKCFYKALELKPDDLMVYRGIACCFYNENQYIKAIEVCDKALSIKHNDCFFLSFKGAAFTGLQDYQNALSCYDRALEINPNFQAAKDEKQRILSAINDRHNSYIQLITNLLKSPDKQAEIFQRNEGLIDAALINTMYAVASNIEANNVDAANYLSAVAQNLSEAILLQEESNFFSQIMQMISQKSSVSQIYAFLEPNLDKLNSNLAKVIEKFTNNIF